MADREGKHIGKGLVRAAALAPAVTAGLYLLTLRGRKGHPAWAVLEQYRYAHRGLHDKPNGIPENSMAAFRRALEHGYGAELDVHLTVDGRLAVIHDDSLLRTCGKDVKVSQCTAAGLDQYRLEGTEEKIPFLEDVLALFEGKAPLIIELKDENNAADLAGAVMAMIDQYPKLDYCIESFHPQCLSWLAKNRPEVCRGQLSTDFIKEKNNLSLPMAFAATHLLSSSVSRPDFIAYNYRDRKKLSLKLSRDLWGIREVSWTVRDRETMEKLEAEGCLIIFENFLP